MTLVEPIGEAQQELVRERTLEYLQQAGVIFARHFDAVPVVFDLKGRCAGMYRVRNGRREIRYNPYLFARCFADNLAVTVPHEVAHYVTDCVFGLRHIRPHGREWRRLMQAFGADPQVTCRYDLTGIPVRNYRRFGYRCGCRTHELTAYRHNRVQRRQATYLCRQCGGRLEFAGEIRQMPRAG